VTQSHDDRPRALVLRAAGINCDAETAFAFEKAGAAATCLHVNRVVENPRQLGDYDLMAIPGGFSHGDDVGAGRILGDRLTRELGAALRKFVDSGKPIIGICNGFQVLTQTDLLPGPVDDSNGRVVALTRNTAEATGGRYVCRWISLQRVGDQCVWTRGWGEDETVELPMAHAEGRIVFRDDAARTAVARANRIAIRYTTPADKAVLPGDLPENPNGSADGIAGLCDESGLVLGLMPHPERFIDPLQHPAWTRLRQNGGADNAPEPAGLRMFRSAVDHVAGVRI
jgi:phosphoribosylformylglycinamidine synthase